MKQRADSPTRGKNSPITTCYNMKKKLTAADAMNVPPPTGLKNCRGLSAGNRPAQKTRRRRSSFNTTLDIENDHKRPAERLRAFFHRRDDDDSDYEEEEEDAMSGSATDRLRAMFFQSSFSRNNSDDDSESDDEEDDDDLSLSATDRLKAMFQSSFSSRRDEDDEEDFDFGGVYKKSPRPLLNFFSSGNKKRYSDTDSGFLVTTAMETD
ncbi:expressed unknown protein [Seminavis robusta]|uniref:Uncharacterized protein n=1 Tax=Seminavis robusta TaxID=568900 RepID=A0A9N8E780_9STRA|nr:expressed unknown protein [Seminavis robusta]|eukprot:Sro740_g195500.1 n/a (209) ;mRNA; f:16599-17225